VRKDKALTQLQEDAEFFDANNVECAAKREEMAWTVLNKLLEWLKDSGGVSRRVTDGCRPHFSSIACAIAPCMRAGAYAC
jgi:hypothetical protein